VTITAGFLAGLRDLVGPQRVYTDPADLVAYSYDATWEPASPDAVVRVASTEEVSRLLALAAEAEVPVHPRGAGTGLSGGAVPRGGGLVLALNDLNRTLTVDPADSVAVVGAGVITLDLHRAAEARGLFYPPDPASLGACTIGGNVAENAGGPRCLKYGVTRDYVLGLEVVLAGGAVLHLGGRTLKNVTGYDLVRLFTGSEGTLGVITEATLRLIPQPPARTTLAALYDDLTLAGETVVAIGQAGPVPAALEILDRASIRYAEAYRPSGLDLAGEALLLIEVDGPDSASVHDQARRLEHVCRGSGARQVLVAEDAAQAGRLWQVRRSVSAAIVRLKPTKISEDATVPRSRVPEMIRRLAAIRAKHGVDLVVFGHAGDGNLHPNIVANRRDPEEMARVERAVNDIFDAALALGGTLSGEHGIGLLKRRFLSRQLGPAERAAMRAVKMAFDPGNILNPGKALAHDDVAGEGPGAGQGLAADDAGVRP